MKLIKVYHRLGCDPVLKELAGITSEKGFFSRIQIEDCDIKTIADVISSEKNKKENKEKTIILGGTHAVTYNCMKKLKGSGFGIILFDAHPDCDPEFSEIIDGNKQKDLLIELIEKQIVPKENIIIIGVRNIRPAEREFLKLHSIRYFTMDKIYDIGAKEVCDVVMETSRNWENLYISVDIDAVDPAFAPAAGCAEPGGLSSREIIYFIQRLNLLKNLRFVDITEIREEKDINGMTSKLAAKLIREIV